MHAGYDYNHEMTAADKTLVIADKAIKSHGIGTMKSRQWR